MTEPKKDLFIGLDTVDPQEVDWLWEPFIPFSMITIMEGDPGVGKSFLAMQLAGLARKMWRAPTEEPGGVLWETGTDRRRSFGVKRCGSH